MRIGSNPLRDSQAQPLEKVFFVVVTHLPNQNGYHAKRLKVIQTCLETMRRTGVRHEVLVWDNGSTKALRRWLQEEYKPDLLMLSANIGKTAARTSAIRMLPPGSIVCYSDDDMYFEDGWLEPQLELLQHFPNVACVTGYPVRTASRWGCENTKIWAQGYAKVDIGKFIPREWEDDFARSIGRDPLWHVEYTRDDMDWRVTYQGKQAYCTSHHCQFVAYASRILPALRYDGMAMGDEKIFDVALDKIGLRLATTQRLARHIGNVLDL